MDQRESDNTSLLKRNESNEVELVQHTIRSVPSIYRCYPITEPSGVQDTSGSTASSTIPSVQPTDPSQQRNETKVLDESLPRFGPSYGPDDVNMKFTKKATWQHVIHKSGEASVELTKQNFTGAIRRVEKQAREAYPLDVAGRRSKFRKMMIRDGCFFIQLAFMILGKSHLDLGYAKTDLVFGGKRYKNDSEWLEAMFFPGNQIPLVILEVLLEQKYFKDLVKKGTWITPTSDLRKTVLFKLLIKPKEDNSLCRSNWSCSLATLRGAQVRAVEQPPPTDVLHCLHTLVLGPAGNEPREYKARYDFDLEANNPQDDMVIGRDNQLVTNYPSDGPTAAVIRNFINLIGVRNTIAENKSTQELEQAKIYVKKLKTGGARSICFTSIYFRAYLYLPTLEVNEDTEIVLSTLQTYEISNKQFGKYDREACSYISFMNDILQTPHDLRYLQRKKIIHGPAVERLPELLRRLNTKDLTLTYNLRNVRRQIANFSSPLERYQNILNLVVFLTVLQTLFAMLSYFKPPKQP